MLLKLSALCIAFGMVSTAQAVTLSVDSDKLTYLVGETVTLSVNGDGEGATTSGIYGRLQYSGSGSITPKTQTQKAVGTGWDPLLPLCNSADCPSGGSGVWSESFSQVAGLTPKPGDRLPADNPFSTVTLVASAVGLVNVNWNTNTSSGFELNFFGLTNAPGASFTIVPEPVTVALIGLGLLGLAGWRRVCA